MTAGYASEAGNFLGTAAEGIAYKGAARHDDDPARQVLALAGIGQALLALRDTLDERLADVADAVTDAGSQVSRAVDQACVITARGRHWPRWAWRRRAIGGLATGAGAVVLSAGDADTVWQALADAAAWRATQDDSPAGPARHAAIEAEYAALRLRLGGDQR